MQRWTILGASVLGASVVLALGAWPALAGKPDEPLEDIEVGTTRVGGPGTVAEQKAAAAADQDDEVISEENLPPKGNKKRIPGLHTIASRYLRAKMWSDACTRYDQILDEGGDEALASDPNGKVNAAKAYFECADLAFFAGDYDKTERLLARSEQYGPKDPRHDALRRRILKETYHKKLGQEDVEGAIAVYEKYQAQKADEDERIWMGDQIAKMAVTAYKLGDKATMERRIAQAEKIAPKNPELGKLVDQIQGESSVFSHLAVIAVVSIIFLASGTRIVKWRRARRIQALAGGRYDTEELAAAGDDAPVRKRRGKNKFIDEDE